MSTSAALRFVVVVLLAVGAAGYLRQKRGEGLTNDTERRPVATPDGPVSPASEGQGPAESTTRRPSPEEEARADRLRRNDEGVAAVEAERFDQAVALFEALVHEDPDEPVFAANLGRALAGRARACEDAGRAAAECIVDLERAVELLPDEAWLVEWLERWRREVDVEAGFAGADSPYFELAFDGERRELVEGTQVFLDRLEAAYTDFRLWFGRDPVLEEGRRPFRVVLYDREEFGSLTGLGDWAAGAFDGTIRLPLEPRAVGGSEWTAVLRHELVHGFIEELAGSRVPGWLNEGLAQWLEGDGAGQAQRARQRLAGAPLIPLEELSGSLLGWRPEKIRRAYAQSVAWVDFLHRGYGKDALLRMVEGYAEQRDAAASFELWTRIPLATVFADFERELSD